MKKLILAAALLSTSAFAAPISDCFKEGNDLDRKYCMDKYLEGYKTTLNTEKKVWAKTGLPAKDKTTREEALMKELRAKKDHINVMQEEINLTQKHLEDLKVAKVAKGPVKEKEKKKKKDKGFRIKL